MPVLWVGLTSNLTQRCDAKRPCTTCTMAKNVSECIYDDKKWPQSAGVYPSDCTDDQRSGQDSGGAGPDVNPTSTPIRSPSESNLSPTSDVAHAAIHESSALETLRADRIPHGHPTGLVLLRKNPFERRLSLGSIPPISIASSFSPQTIPPELWIPLSFLGEERLQVQFSEKDTTDLDLRSCVSEQGPSVTNSPPDIRRLWVLFRLPKLGSQFSSRRLDALLRGDQSVTVLDRAFVCGSHVLGMPFSLGVANTPTMVRFHARRTQTAWECLAELFKGQNYGVSAQAALLIASSSILLRMTQRALLFVQKSCDFIKAGDVRFVPVCGRPPEFSEELHETLVTLSQTIYWANYLFLMRGGPEPRATTKLEKEFRQELPVGGPIPASLYIGLIFYCSRHIRCSLRSVL